MHIKDIVNRLPFFLGKIFVSIPFKYRLGNVYSDSSKHLFNYCSEDIMVKKLNSIKLYSEQNFSLYKNLFINSNVFGNSIKNISDWKKLPLIDKTVIRHHLGEFQGKFKINTGGTTGEPFSFYVDKNAWAREWAHMHFIWGLKGYDYKQLKITLRGKDLGNKLFQYNLVHNEFVINTYKDFSIRSNAIQFCELINKRKIKFVHGYPSAIYNTFLELESSLSSLEIESIKENLNVALFGSEFPVNYMTKYLESIWGLDYISWYGHSEMCILAYDEFKTNNYVPFYSYGFPEVVDGELIGTSYHNTDMPLIRYRTGDLVEGKYENGLLKSFSIKEGRSGDFIEDINGKKIPLTGLIFGRHHKAFETFDYVQVRQIIRGKAIIYVTDKRGFFDKSIESLFDFSNVEIDFSFERLDSPILSKAGKFKLKV